MYTVVERQDADGMFAKLASAVTRSDAEDKAKAIVNAREHGYAVYVFCDQDARGTTHPYLVARVSRNVSRHFTGALVSYY